MAAGNTIMSIISILGSVVGAIGQASDNNKKKIAGMVGQDSSLIQGAQVGSSGSVQAPEVYQGTDNSYLEGVASRPGWATTLGGYMSAVGDIAGEIQNIGKQSSDGSRAAKASLAGSDGALSGVSGATKQQQGAINASNVQSYISSIGKLRS